MQLIFSYSLTFITCTVSTEYRSSSGDLLVAKDHDLPEF